MTLAMVLAVGSFFFVLWSAPSVYRWSAERRLRKGKK